MIRKLLVANRGEIACRVFKSARRMGIATVAVHSDADARALHVAMADEAVAIGPAAAARSYIAIDRVIEAVRAAGADAVHPGYGFLSENPLFAQALEAEGVAFVGPPSRAIEAMGDKITSKRIAAEAGVSTVPGHMGVVADAEAAVRIAGEVGFPVMLKASAGGGGKGMRIAWSADEVAEGFRASKAEAKASFGDDRMFIERFVASPRHIEIQLIADRHGNAVYLGERECSIQRRNQKVVEEAPSPFLDETTRRAMGEQAVALAKAVGYVSAGTVEFIVDGEKNFYFLEMNTRLQVEHPVTELVTGVDLVEQMIRVAAGEPLPFTQDDIRLQGWAIESRLYAEDPYRNFLPSIGRLVRYRPPSETEGYRPGTAPGDAGSPVVRNDTGVFEGGEISIHYDPMIAKLCTWAETREAAVDAMADALDGFEVEGIGHNLPFLSAVMDHPRFRSGNITTAFIAEEFPEGFHGVALSEDVLRRIAASAVAMHRVAEVRRARISGRMDNHERVVGDDWVVTLRGHGTDRRYETRIEADPDGATVRIGDAAIRVESDWRPGATLAWVRADGVPMALKVAETTDGFRLRHRGADLRVHVRAPRAAALAALMPVAVEADTSKLLLCPMPGLVVRIDVAEGERVESGQALAVVEAMKMENVLRAERAGTVSAVRAGPGDSLAVDDVILEFE